MPDAAEFGDGIRFLLQQALGQAIRRNAAQSHTPCLCILVVDVDRIPHQKQVVSTVKPCRTGTHDGDASFAAIHSGLHAVEEFMNRHARVVAYPSFDVSNGYGLVDFVSATGRFAGAYAHAAAGGDQRIVIEQNPCGEFRMSVAHVVNVSRHIDMSRAGFDAFGRDRHEHIAAHGFCGFKEAFAEVFHGSHKGCGCSAADAAKTREHHLLGGLIDMVPVNGGASSFNQIAQGEFDESRTRTARCAATAGSLRHFLVIAQQNTGKTHGIVKHQKAGVPNDNVNRIAGIEVHEGLEVKSLRGLVVAQCVVVLDPVPYAVADHLFLSCCRDFVAGWKRKGIAGAGLFFWCFRKPAFDKRPQKDWQIVLKSGSGKRPTLRVVTDPDRRYLFV